MHHYFFTLLHIRITNWHYEEIQQYNYVTVWCLDLPTRQCFDGFVINKKLYPSVYLCIFYDNRLVCSILPKQSFFSS